MLLDKHEVAQSPEQQPDQNYSGVKPRLVPFLQHAVGCRRRVNRARSKHFVTRARRLRAKDIDEEIFNAQIVLGGTIIKSSFPVIVNGSMTVGALRKTNVKFFATLPTSHFIIS